MTKVYGVGVRDYSVSQQADTKEREIECNYYRTWYDMIRRCYDSHTQSKNPTYKGCTVSKEWHYYSAFRSWMIKQDWKGKQIDKDIITPGNREYSPGNCCFVPNFINSLLLERGASRGKWPLGVHMVRSTNKFVAQISIKCVPKNLGTYDTPEEASQAYRKAKSDYIRKHAEQITDSRIKMGLERHARRLDSLRE